MIAASGTRRRIVQVQQHDGTLLNGQPTYQTAADWDPLEDLLAVPVSYEGVTGGEVLRGLQVEANATGVVRLPSTPRTRKIKPRMRMVMNERPADRTLNVLSVIERGGDQRELIVQVREQGD